ncbi:hypothetical protein [Phyllobacterium bourgognense]|uniref:Uncharacterized protein n=1 Tax=Phyllobacterium bourgognense TaxID=314236 RepID=A0A368YKP4_9HYPH|nr:hypothetical protein [Phyllobacterium bourgognense]RCW80078.1 hypothetical protein C7476_11543 [Phyllobacterium bourgognense]
MRIIKRHINAREGGDGYTVAFVYEDGKRVLVDLSAANSVGLGQDELIRQAARLLDQIDESGVRGDLPPHDAAEGRNAPGAQTASSSGTDFSTTPDQPEGPVAAKDPLLEEQDDDANIVGLEGEGIIKP